MGLAVTTNEDAPALLNGTEKHPYQKAAFGVLIIEDANETTGEVERKFIMLSRKNALELERSFSQGEFGTQNTPGRNVYIADCDGRLKHLGNTGGQTSIDAQDVVLHTMLVALFSAASKEKNGHVSFTEQQQEVFDDWITQGDDKELERKRAYVQAFAPHLLLSERKAA